MPRPIKPKIIRQKPKFDIFPSTKKDSQTIYLSLEEYETIRLIDHCGYDQAKCAQSMEISRSTVVSLYNSARKKLARHMIEGLTMCIKGGNYIMANEQAVQNTIIAVPCVESDVYGHFGHCPRFMIYTIQNAEITSEQALDTTDKGCQLLAPYLKEHGVKIVICGNIGAGAKNNLLNQGIQVFPGASGHAKKQVESFLAGTLAYNENAQCAHHDHSHCGHH